MRKSDQTGTATWASAIELEGVSKAFEQKRPMGLFRFDVERIDALKEVCFSVRPGEFVAYAGPNGAGKSTTFKLLCGMLAPQKGDVRVFGSDPIAGRIPAMRRTGVLFGNRSELWWDHPVQTSFEWKKTVWSIPDGTYDRMLKKTVELLDIGPFLKTFARELSLGQRMRANLALTLLHDPELILLDEPTLGLDVLAKRLMIEFLKQHNRERGATILVTSHDMDDLTEMARRILLINKGEIAFDGDYESLMRKTGDKRVIRVAAPGPAPKIQGAAYAGEERGYHVYEYDSGALPVGELMRRIGEIDGISDVETGRAPIERVIADLYARWGKDAAAR